MDDIYTVSAMMPKTVFGLTGVESIKQNVMIIATMYKNQMVMDRDLGMDSSLIDKPETYRQMLIPSAVIEAVNEGEPRAEVTNVIVDDPDPNEPGKINFRVQFRERGES